MVQHQKMVQADRQFAEFVDRYRKDKRRFTGDMTVAARNRLNQLKDAREEQNQLKLPESPEAKAFVEAYQQLLDNQIKAWDGGGLKLAQGLEDPAKAKEFDQFLTRLQEQENADQVKVKEAHRAFLKANDLSSRP